MSVPFLLRPDAPLTQILSFLTDVIPHKDGTERRISLRIAPREAFSGNFVADTDYKRQICENALFSNQAGTFLLPKWPYPAGLTANASAGATTISLNTTVSDFRVGEGLVLISADDLTVDGASSVITGVATNSLTFTGALADNWSIGAQVYPLTPTTIGSIVRSQRPAINEATYTFVFECLNNNKDLSGGTLPAGFSTLGFGDDVGIPILDDRNWIGTQLAETSDIDIIEVDGKTGIFSPLSYWPYPRRGSFKTFASFNRTRLWQLVQLFHFLQGQQTAFLLPTFANDITPNGAATSTGTTLNIVNANWTNNIGVYPRKYIRIYNTASAGGFEDHEVSSCTVVNSTTEQLTVTPAFSTNISVSQVQQICLLEKVRFATDEFKFSHIDLRGQCRVGGATKAVLADVAGIPGTAEGGHGWQGGGTVIADCATCTTDCTTSTSGSVTATVLAVVDNLGSLGGTGAPALPDTEAWITFYGAAGFSTPVGATCVVGTSCAPQVTFPSRTDGAPAGTFQTVTVNFSIYCLAGSWYYGYQFEGPGGGGADLGINNSVPYPDGGPLCIDGRPQGTIVISATGTQGSLIVQIVMS